MTSEKRVPRLQKIGVYNNAGKRIGSRWSCSSSDTVEGTGHTKEEAYKNWQIAKDMIYNCRLAA